MSPSETIDQLRQQHKKLQADIVREQAVFEERHKSVADLEAQVLAFEEGEGGNLSQFTRLMRATSNMKALKQQLEALLRTIVTLLNDSADVQETLRVHLDKQAQKLNDIDKEGPYKDGKTFQQKLDEASAMLKE